MVEPEVVGRGPLVRSRLACVPRARGRLEAHVRPFDESSAVRRHEGGEEVAGSAPITAVIDGWALGATLFGLKVGDTPFRTCVGRPRSFHCTPCSAITHARLGMRCKRTRRKSKDRAATRRRTRGPSKRRKHSRSRGCCGEICAWVPRRPAEFE